MTTFINVVKLRNVLNHIACLQAALLNASSFLSLKVKKVSIFLNNNILNSIILLRSQRGLRIYSTKPEFELMIDAFMHIAMTRVPN